MSERRTPEPTSAADDVYNAPDSGAGVDRRTFLQGIGAAGVIGAVGAAGLDRFARPAVAAPFSPVQQVAQARNDFPRPEGLRPGAQLDCRWPVAYEQTIPEAVRLVTQYFSAWSSQNLEGMASVLHYPFAIIEQVDPIVFQSADEFLANPPMTLAPVDRQVNHPGHYTGRIAPGSYNILNSIDVPMFCPVGAVVALTFTRYSDTANKLLECDGIYTVTNNDGRWGIELVSTIMTPVDHIGVPQHDAEQTALRSGQDSMLRYTNRHRPARVADPEERFVGRRASVSFGYGPRARAGDARNDDPMAGWRVSGILSRLSVSDVQDDSPSPTPGTPDPDFPMFTQSYNFRQFAEWAGGNVGQWGDTFTNPYQPRVLANGRHVNMHKAHTMGGYIRHTPDLTMISETRSISIRAYRDGQWGSVGSIGQITYHDRSNSYERG